ncbi:MAG: glycosyltransferase family 9 protein [Desulfomonilaceae bacterium]
MNIWVVRPGALGDTLLTLPLLYSIRENNPTHSVTLIGSKAYREIIPREFGFNAVDGPDSLWMFQPEQYMEKPILKPCDIAYVILKDPNGVISRLRCAGVQEIFNASPVPYPGLNIVESLHSQLGLAVPRKRPMLKGRSGKRPWNVAWFHPGSGGRMKLAPLKLFRQISTILKERTGCDIVITLGEADMEIKADEEWGLWLEQSRAEILELRPLTEICARMSSARFFVGNDSGMSHLAAHLGVFSVLFFISTDPVQWKPWVCSSQTLVFDYRTIDLRGRIRTSADEVTNTAITRQKLYDSIYYI